jgi:simple sugar transport system permease protein
MTTATLALRTPLTAHRRYLAAGTFVVLGLIDIAVFGLLAHSGDTVFALALPGAKVHVPSIRLPAAPVCYLLGAVSIALGGLRAAVNLDRRSNRLAITAVLLCFVVSLLCWAGAGEIPWNLVNLLQGTLSASIPLILGALAGCMCERSGVINIAIEGQLLVGSFAGALFASALGGLWVGLIAGSLAGGLVGLLLAVLAITFLMDQIILGVVLNVLALGITDYLYDRLMAQNPNYNTGVTFSNIKIPLLGDIPLIGPIFFDSTIFLYITYAMLILIQVAMFHTRWGLRVRAVGEHPTAADTVGIAVLWTRYRNVILGGLIAGIGGAYLTVGSVGSFNPDISSGFGYIALAALIFGRWTPLGAMAAALLFGFCKELALVLPTVNATLPSPILNTAPYVATIIAVAGLVGRVRAPNADGKPYVKA